MNGNIFPLEWWEMIELIGQEVHGVTVHNFSELEPVLSQLQPDVAVLCVPKSMANSIANEVAKAGVPAIWNFTNIELQFEEEAPIIENIHFSDSLLTLGYYLAESMDEAAARAARSNHA